MYATYYWRNEGRHGDIGTDGLAGSANKYGEFSHLGKRIKENSSAVDATCTPLCGHVGGDNCTGLGAEWQSGTVSFLWRSMSDRWTCGMVYIYVGIPKASAVLNHGPLTS